MPSHSVWVVWKEDILTESVTNIARMKKEEEEEGAKLECRLYTQRTAPELGGIERQLARQSSFLTSNEGWPTTTPTTHNNSIAGWKNALNQS